MSYLTHTPRVRDNRDTVRDARRLLNAKSAPTRAPYSLVEVMLIGMIIATAVATWFVV